MNPPEGGRRRRDYQEIGYEDDGEWIGLGRVSRGARHIAWQLRTFAHLWKRDYLIMAFAFLLDAAEERRLMELNHVRMREMRRNFSLWVLPDPYFKKRFRLNKTQFQHLCEEVAPLLPNPQRRSAISKEIQILAAVSFFAHGSYQKSTGDSCNLALSQPVQSRAIKAVTNALNTPGILRNYIRFPYSHQERLSIKMKFMDKFGFPGVLGCIDGTHVAIVRPHQEEEIYFNRKLYHSLNVMLICDPDLYIMYVDASFGGASHDSHILQSSVVKDYLANLHEQGEQSWLLGDSGYPQRPYLMTPILRGQVRTPAEENYNRVHIKTRNVVERCFGVLKTRWRCLLSHRVLHYTPERAAKIVNACCVLHNMCANDRVQIHERGLRRLRRDGRRQPRQASPEALQAVPVSSREQIVQRLWANRHH